MLNLNWIKHSGLLFSPRFITVFDEFKVFSKNYDHGQFETRAQRCQGRGIGFAKCVKEAIDKFGCQKITKSGDDYISSDC